MPVDDYYSLIGVSPDADRDTIRDAYRSRRSELDDSEQGRTSAAQLNRAWNVLSDGAQRARYDDQLAAARADEDVERSGQRAEDALGEAVRRRPEEAEQRAVEARSARPGRARGCRRARAPLVRGAERAHRAHVGQGNAQDPRDEGGRGHSCRL